MRSSPQSCISVKRDSTFSETKTELRISHLTLHREVQRRCAVSQAFAPPKSLNEIDEISFYHANVEKAYLSKENHPSPVSLHACHSPFDVLQSLELAVEISSQVIDQLPFNADRLLYVQQRRIHFTHRHGDHSYSQQTPAKANTCRTLHLSPAAAPAAELLSHCRCLRSPRGDLPHLL